MIKEGVSPTVARRLNYSERSGKVVDTRSQSNANHESIARVTTGPPAADTDLVCMPPRGNASRESTVRVATGSPVADTNFSIDPDYVQLEAVTLHPQQPQPLKIVIYLDGSHTRSALNFYLQRDSALGVCRKSMLQGFALKEKSAKFQTALVSIPQFFIHLMFVRSTQSMWVLEMGTAQILQS